MADEDSGAAVDAPLPPPPPPPPPPQVRPDDGLHQKRRPTSTPHPTQNPKKRRDFRDLLALFHDESMDTDTAKRVWSSLWQTTLVESQEDHRKRQTQEKHGLKRKKSGEHDHGPMSTRGGVGVFSRHGNLTQDYLKRARQSSTVSTDSSEFGKASRLGGRFPKNVTKGSKLLQKFGGRT